MNITKKLAELAVGDIVKVNGRWSRILEIGPVLAINDDSTLTYRPSKIENYGGQSEGVADFPHLCGLSYETQPLMRDVRPGWTIMFRRKRVHITSAENIDGDRVDLWGFRSIRGRNFGVAAAQSTHIRANEMDPVNLVVTS